MAICKSCGTGELLLETQSKDGFSAVLLVCDACGQIVDRKYYVSKTGEVLV